MAVTPFDEHVVALDADTLTELMRSRHSVRAFADVPIEGAVREALDAQVTAENERARLSMQLCLDAPGAFDGRLAHYGSFRNVRNHLALVGPSGPGLDEAVGYAGEKVVLLARALGVDSCWVALTYDRRRSPARVGTGERYALAIALGYGEKPGAEHPTKPAERLCRVNGAAPAWFSAGVEAARLAPTALNQQRFRFELLEDGRTVRARALPALSCGKVDLGIARLHFELGANAVSHDWTFEA